MSKELNRTAEVKLTKLEVEALLSAAGNGYCEGDYFCDPDGSDSGYGGKRMDAAYQRAVEKLKAGKVILTCDDLESEVDEYKSALKSTVEALKEAKGWVVPHGTLATIESTLEQVKPLL